MFEISTLKLIKNESLTHTVNLGIGSAFSKGLGSAFSEGPGPGLCPLYKVCPFAGEELNLLSHQNNISIKKRNTRS